MMARRRWLTAGLAILALGAAGCGDSPEDNAHDSGKDVGQALRAVTDANDAASLQSATAELRTAVGDVSDDVSSRVRSQVAVQRDTIDKAIGGLKSSITAPDASTREEAKAGLQTQVETLRSQASGFADTNDSVTNSFWDGVKDGYDDD